MNKEELKQNIQFLTDIILSDNELNSPQYGPDGNLVPRVFNIVKDGKEGLLYVELWNNKWNDKEGIYRLDIEIGDKFLNIDIRTITDSLNNLKINKLRELLPLLQSVVYGRTVEVTDEDKELCERNKFTLINGRIEAGIYDLTPVLQRFNKINSMMGNIVYLKSYNERTSNMGSDTFELWLDESKMDLLSLKKELYKLRKEKKIDIHVLVGSLDYSQFQGLRDRNSPQPKTN